MKKRAAVMAVVSALICGVVASQAPDSVPQNAKEPAAEEKPVIAQLAPDTQEISYQTAESVGIARAIGVKDTLVPSSDYGEVMPYPAEVTGWKADGTPVYRYALADSSGELITEAVYTSVLRKQCGSSLVWLMTSEAEDGSARVSCAAQNGSWILGPFDGSITVEDDRIFVQRATDSAVTTVYNSSGKIEGQIAGTMQSYSGDIIVSSAKKDGATVWYLNQWDTLTEVASLDAVYVGAFSDESATVQLTETEWGFVDEKGTVTKTEAAWLDECYDGYALAKSADGKYGVLDDSGKEIADMKYAKGVLCGLEQPIYQLWEDDETCIVLSASSGQKLALPDDLHAQQLMPLPSTYFAYTNESGNTVVFDDLDSAELEGSVQFHPQGRNVLLSAGENSYQLIDLKEGKAGKVHPYRYVAPSQEEAYGDAVFTIADPDTGLCGIANNRGRIVLDPAYDSIYSIDGSYFAAVQGSWSGIVDSNGDWIVRTQLTGIK